MFTTLSLCCCVYLPITFNLIQGRRKLVEVGARQEYIHKILGRGGNFSRKTYIEKCKHNIDL